MRISFSYVQEIKKTIIQNFPLPSLVEYQFCNTVVSLPSCEYKYSLALCMAIYIINRFWGKLWTNVASDCTERSVLSIQVPYLDCLRLINY